MDLSEALDAVVSRTGHARFRELCDPAHPDHQPGMAAVVLGLAGAPAPEPAPALAPEPIRVRPRIGLARRAQLVTCPYRENCGCAAPKCWARSRPVVLAECHTCMPYPAGAARPQT